MVHIQSDKFLYTISEYTYAKIYPLINGLDPFDLDVVLDALMREKVLITPEKVDEFLQ